MAAQNPFDDLPNVKSSQFDPFSDLPPKDDTSFGQKALIGLGRGLTQAGQGIKQVGLSLGEKTGFLPTGTTNAYTQQADAEKALYESTPVGQSTTGKVGEFVGGTLPYLTIPGGAAGGLGQRALTGALSGTATGALQYVPEGGNRGENAVLGGYLGGALGAAIPPLLTGVWNLGAKAINTARGKYATPEAKALIDLGKQYDVPVYAQDVSQNRVIKNLGNYLDNTAIIGTQGDRQVQMDAAKEAAQALTDKYKGILDNTAYGGKTGLKKIEAIAADTANPRASAAQDLLKQIQSSGDDWQNVLQTSGNVNLFRSKLIADQKYNKVSELADQFGGVPMGNTQKAVSQAMADVKDSILPDNGLLNKLQAINENLNSREFNYSQMRQARSDISNLINDYFTGGNAAIGRKGVGTLQSIKNAIGEDMNQFARSNGSQLKTVWQNADNFYQNAVAKYKDRTLAQSLKNANPDEIYSKFITRGSVEGGKGTGRAQNFYDALDNKGKAAVRYGMVSDAFERAYKTDPQQFSPGEFAGLLDSFAASKGVIFKGQDKAEIDGFKKLMRGVEKSYQTLNKPPTGITNNPYIIGLGLAGGAVIDPIKTAGVAGATYALKKLFTTDAGKRFLLSSSALKPNSPALQKASETFIKLMQQGAITQGVQPSSQGMNHELSQ